jgi:hypothetical protein
VDIPIEKVMEFVDELADTFEIQEFLIQILYKKKRFSDIVDFCDRFNIIEKSSSIENEESDILKIYNESLKMNSCKLPETILDSKGLEFITPKNPILFVNNSKSFQIAKVKKTIYVTDNLTFFSH